MRAIKIMREHELAKQNAKVDKEAAYCISLYKCNENKQNRTNRPGNAPKNAVSWTMDLHNLHTNTWIQCARLLNGLAVDGVYTTAQHTRTHRRIRSHKYANRPSSHHFHYAYLSRRLIAAGGSESERDGSIDKIFSPIANFRNLSN